MKKILQNLNNMKFYNKMIVIYIACTIIPFFVISSFYYSITLHKIESQRITDAKYTIGITKKSLENYFDQGFSLTNKAYLSDSLDKVLNKKDNDSIDKIKSSNYISEIINYFPIYDSIDLLGIYSDNSSLLNGGMVHQINDQVKNQMWFKRFQESNLDMFIDYYLNDYEDKENPKKCLSIIRKMNYFKRSNSMQFIKIDLRIDVIRKILGEHNLYGTYYLIDDSNNIICSTDTVGDLKSIQKYSYNLGDMNKRHLLVLNEKLTMPNGWSIVAEINKNSAANMFNTEVNTFILLILLNIVFATTIIWYVSKSFVKRLKLLTECTSKMKEEKFETIDEKEIGNDEIAVLIRGMNSAILKIKQLIEEVYQSKLKNTQIELEKKRTELKALQSQVNPHFMFNVLEAVRMKSIIKNEGETARIIKYLSKMFRRTISWGEDLITIQEEMVFVQEYLALQKYRFDDEFKSIIHVDEKALTCRIPKMSIQIFVENACIHGLEKSSADKIININIVCKDEKVIIEIADNGAGMDKNKLSSILENRENEYGNNRNIGISNVRRRYQLYYGENFKFNIISIQGEMTKVLIEIPLSE